MATEYGHYQTDQWITEQEACAWLKCTRHSLYRYRRDGILRNYIRMGKGPRAVIRYSWRELRDALMPDDKELWRLHNEKRGKRKSTRGGVKRTAKSSANVSENGTDDTTRSILKSTEPTNGNG